MIGVDAQPVDLRADGGVSPDQQQPHIVPVAAGRPSLEDFSLLGIVTIGLRPPEPLWQARCQGFDQRALQPRLGFPDDFERQCAEPSSALTMFSHITLASANSIMVLSRKNSSLSTPA